MPKIFVPNVKVTLTATKILTASMINVGGIFVAVALRTVIVPKGSNAGQVAASFQGMENDFAKCLKPHYEKKLCKILWYFKALYSMLYKAA